MAKRRDLTARLQVGAVDDAELATVLSSVLPRGAQFRLNEVEYRTGTDEWALSLTYRGGKIVAATEGPAMTPEIEEQLVEAIERLLLTAADRRVCRWTMFSSRPVDGWWRFRDQFQIVPAPAEAPRPNVLLADHPFLVDFVYDDSPNVMLRNNRWARRSSDLMLVLNLLLRPGIGSPSNRGRHHWVWAPLGSDPPVIWAGEGYIIPKFQYVVEDLPTTAGMTPLVEVGARTYYDRLGGPDTLTIPSELTTLFDLYYGLTGEAKERFLRACYWYQMASTVWVYSQSLHLTCLVNAAECLAGIDAMRPVPRRVAALVHFLTRRPTQPPKPTWLFLNFMKRFAPGRPSRQKLDDLYAARSEITHGERLLQLDQASVPFGLSQISATDREVGDNASLLVRGALINWLWSHGSAGESHLIATGLPTAKPAHPGTKSGFKVITPGD